MAAVPFFRDTNAVAMTSRENTLLMAERRSLALSEAVTRNEAKIFFTLYFLGATTLALRISQLSL